jgi:hypothetical protein
MVDKRYLKGIKLGKEIRMLLPTTEMLPEGEAIDRLSGGGVLCARTAVGG